MHQPESELICRLALRQVSNIGAVHTKILVQHFNSASAIFQARHEMLEKLEGIGTIRASSIRNFRDFSKAETELAFLKKYNIRMLFLTDEDYPKRYLNCYDPPPLLFFKGNTDLNASKMVGIVGTRNNTSYGKDFTEKLVKELAEVNPVIVSGLAFGIDGIAHKAALKYNLPTVGALGHGLDTIYPHDHTSLAKDMVKNGGGLLTEFFSGTPPDKHNFPQRNRVVAGLCDVVILVESGIKGGSMITAELANGYNRDVFAVPGRSIDSKSAGCNELIRTNKAIMLTDPQELLEVMGWNEKKKSERPQQKQLFIELSPDEQLIVDILREKETVHIDEINLQSGLSSSAVAAAILNLELQHVVMSLPGKIYRLT